MFNGWLTLLGLHCPSKSKPAHPVDCAFLAPFCVDTNKCEASEYHLASSAPCEASKIRETTANSSQVTILLRSQGRTERLEGEGCNQPFWPQSTAGFGLNPLSKLYPVTSCQQWVVWSLWLYHSHCDRMQDCCRLSNTALKYMEITCACLCMQNRREKQCSLVKRETRQRCNKS